ncbi:MAG: hypothetical protein GC162_13825 [Planctomycetes bacterium]|nr:hypothetical protein [Planctomycetota bacterium]
MTKRGPSLRHWGVRHNLAEVAEALAIVLRDLETGAHDHEDAAAQLRHDFAHLVAHLNHAWTAIWISNTAYETVGDRHLHLVNLTVPNYCGRLSLVEAERPAVWKRWGIVVPAIELINPKAAGAPLRAALGEVERIIDTIDAGEDDPPRREALRHDFARVLGHLCCAWHTKWMSDEQIARLDEPTLDAMRHTLPDFAAPTSYQIVGLDDPMPWEAKVAH